MNDLAELVYKAADRTFASCLICSVNPTTRCDVCDDGICDVHAQRITELEHCPLCYAIQLVNQRLRILDVLKKAMG